ncbi:hypothetical protein VFPPC_11920 [Pochonia chlamydosporia 170]|uniref:Uncharacterized protein n=1 Tax=Pochonia chlamydosporia 170 TaxID=1380566 RepID=A0A179EZ72_METCM|nr:hypothetical protein VFPPC_11920 [Pochonia chlamydosporia 170]OAQ58199.1 hypothetical protein VFPPC_11920 [Pochonia chlamydosporia 170]
MSRQLTSTNDLHLGPCIGPQNSAAAAILNLTTPGVEPTRVIDVREIYPDLEGIPIKAKTVQNPTFETTFSTLKLVGSPTASHENALRNHANKERKVGLTISEKSDIDCRRYGNVSLPGAEDQSKRAPATDESYHLIMHAGHTPRHSLSSFPAMAAAEINRVSACNRGSRPAAFASSALEHKHGDTSSNCHYSRKAHVRAGEQVFLEDLNFAGHPGPADDAPVQRSPTIENLPEQDEIFWAELSQRLERISLGEQPLPKVLLSLAFELSETSWYDFGGVSSLVPESCNNEGGITAPGNICLP